MIPRSSSAPGEIQESGRDLLLGFDIGSHSCKGVLVDLQGRTKAEAARPHESTYPALGREEQDPRTWWDSFVEIVGELVCAVDEAQRIAAIGITGFVPGLCMLDERGELLSNAIMHTDIRAGEELAELNSLLEEEITLGTLLPKLMWIKKHRREVFERIEKVLVPHGYLVYRLTGRISCDYDTGSIFGGIFDPVGKQWKEDVCSRVGLPLDILPSLYPASATAGLLSRTAAESTGLAEGVPVIVGSGDSFTALIGAGAARTGDLFIYLGTSGTRLMVEKPLEEVADGPHFGPGKVHFIGRIFSCGETLERYRRILGSPPWKELDDAAAQEAAGADGLIAIPNLKQRIEGEGELSSRDNMLGLTDVHGVGHIFRAAMEGIAFCAREGAEGALGRARRVVISGGPVKSGPMCRIMAALFGGRVTAAEQGHSGVGAAILAGYGREIMPNLRINPLNTCEQAGIVDADEGEVETYGELLRRFVRMRRLLHEQAEHRID